jgi:UDP-N-acetylmuramyl tripeptide synthase
MRLATVLAAAAVLGLGIEVAHANDRVGTIQSVRADERTFTLSDGNVYILQANAPASAMETLKRMRPGQKVRVTYEANAARAYVSDIVPVE